ncbi:MAG: DNA cytosine methyltransferase [Clostridia bacterium]|nr:DNA cytosine methyltransferase [Clostridia bacterium]
MKVLIACEESQEVCKAFREAGHEAYSLDIKPCSGGHPEWHIQKAMNPYIRDGYCSLTTQDGAYVYVNSRWDLIIAHPPCTYLSNVGNRHHSLKSASAEAIVERTIKRIEAEGFFMMFANAKCKRIAIENPQGVMNSVYRQPDQTIDPYMFAESEEDEENYCCKRTCLWLKGLPPLWPENDLSRPDNKKIYGINKNGKTKSWEETRRKSGEERRTIRSKTFPGIAKAMAKQWGALL